MDNRYYENVIAFMQNFFDENGFAANGDSFISEKKAVKINYDDASQSYVLNVADVKDGNVGEYEKASVWLFDDSQNAKDAEYVAIDFVDTIKKNLGIKSQRRTGIVDLPSASDSDVMNITGFAKKFLDVFPQYKDAYKEHITKYGNFLYMEFFGTYFVPQIKEMVLSDNKKTVKKLLSLCESAYIAGDTDTVNLVVACLAAATTYDEKIKQAVFEMLKENSHFKMSVESFIPVLKKKKDLSKLLIK